MMAIIIKSKLQLKCSLRLGSGFFKKPFLDSKEIEVVSDLSFLDVCSMFPV